MAPIPPIFTLDIPAYKSATHTAPAGGTFVLIQPHPQTYLLTFTSPPDNRLTPPFVRVWSQALDIILTTLPPGVVITTSGVSKFYSNGLDYASAVNDPNFFANDLHPLWRRLVTFPWPTIALINGHAFAGALMTAMLHDYRIMNPHKGFVCLNELDFGAPLTPAMASIFRVKLSMTTFRTLILEGKRFNALAALEAGIIDGVGGLEETIKIATEFGLHGKLRDVGKGSYGLIKEQMYREILRDLDADAQTVREEDAAQRKDRKLRLQKVKDVAEKWKNEGGKLSVLPKPKL